MGSRGLKVVTFRAAVSLDIWDSSWRELATFRTECRDRQLGKRFENAPDFPCVRAAIVYIDAQIGLLSRENAVSAGDLIP